MKVKPPGSLWRGNINVLESNSVLFSSFFFSQNLRRQGRDHFKVHIKGVIWFKIWPGPVHLQQFAITRCFLWDSLCRKWHPHSPRRQESQFIMAAEVKVSYTLAATTISLVANANSSLFLPYFFSYYILPSLPASLHSIFCILLLLVPKVPAS